MDWCICLLVECFVLIFAKHEAGGGATAVFGDYQVGVTSLGDEDHVTGLVLDGAIGVCVQVVEDTSGFVVSVFGWG